jgi:glycosyltransferase involved in cell wall biosynthesis
MAALSVGRPILASRIGLFAELLEDGKHGFLVPQDDPAALAAALERLVADDATRAAMAANVRALAAAIPSWGAIATQTATLYQSAQSDRA